MPAETYGDSFECSEKSHISVSCLKGNGPQHSHQGQYGNYVSRDMTNYAKVKVRGKAKGSRGSNRNMDNTMVMSSVCNSQHGASFIS